jgi:hypothetical protein
MRRSADPALTFAGAAALTLVVSLPTIVRAGHGAIDISDGAARIVALFAVLWCVVHLVATLVAWLTSRTASPPPPGPAAVRRLPAPDGVDHRRVDAA